MAASPEREQNTDEKLQLSPENEERRRLYEERFFNLDRRLRDFVDRIKSCQVSLLEKGRTLATIRKEKRVITINWKEASSLCNELKMDFPPYVRDLRKCLESNLEDSNIIEDISEQDSHQSEEAELMLAEITDLQTKTLCLSLQEMHAECYVEKLISYFRSLEEKYNKLLVGISEIEKHDQLSYPTKPESEEDTVGHLRKAKFESRM